MNSFVGTDGLHLDIVSRTAEKVKYLGVCVSIDRSFRLSGSDNYERNETKRILQTAD
jgi:hypothetical protein